MDTIQQGEPAKIVVSFADLAKPLILNKVNGNTIVELYGDDTDHWLGGPWNSTPLPPVFRVSRWPAFVFDRRNHRRHNSQLVQLLHRRQDQLSNR